MTSLLSKPKGPDPAIAAEQLRQQAALRKREEDADNAIDARKRAGGTRAGSRFLLANAEQGSGGLASSLSTV